MASPGSSVKALLIRPWIHPVAPLRQALRAAGIEPRFTRIDIEPALHAALERGGFEIVIVDPATPGLPRSMIDTRLREHQIEAPVVEVGCVDDLGARVKLALASRRC